MDLNLIIYGVLIVCGVMGQVHPELRLLHKPDFKLSYPSTRTQHQLQKRQLQPQQFGPQQQQTFNSNQQASSQRQQQNFNDFSNFNGQQQEALPTLPPVFIPPNNPIGPAPQLQSPIRNLFRQPENNNFSISNIFNRFLNFFNLNNN